MKETYIHDKGIKRVIKSVIIFFILEYLFWKVTSKVFKSCYFTMPYKK
jgi:hypothetical protein